MGNEGVPLELLRIAAASNMEFDLSLPGDAPLLLLGLRLVKWFQMAEVLVQASCFGGNDARPQHSLFSHIPGVSQVGLHGVAEDLCTRVCRYCSVGQRRREAGLKQQDRLLGVPTDPGTAASPEQPVRITGLGLYLPDSNLLL